MLLFLPIVHSTMVDVHSTMVDVHSTMVDVHSTMVDVVCMSWRQPIKTPVLLLCSTLINRNTWLKVTCCSLASAINFGTSRTIGYFLLVLQVQFLLSAFAFF